jgi:nitrate reductase NapAB chaperone NapD
MPIKSYIVTPLDGQLRNLESHVLTIAGCEVIHAGNRDVLIVITDTKDDATDEQVHQQLLSLPSLEHITLVSGFSE